MLFLARHGQTYWNLAHRKQGQKDSPLTIKGFKQAEEVGMQLRQACDRHKIPKNSLIVYTSQLGRAIQSAAIICERLNIPYDHICKEPRLNEHCFGDWEGLNEEEIEYLYPGELSKRYKTTESRWHYQIPGERGESYAKLHNRVSDFTDSLCEVTNGKNVLIVAHEMVSKVMRGYLLELDIKATLELEHPQDTIYELINPYD